MKTLAALMCVAILAGGCSSSPATEDMQQETASASVAISNFAFDPVELEIAAGDTVVWTNDDDIAHTVTSGRAKKQGVPGVSKNRDAAPDEVFDSGTMELDDTFDFTFQDSGTFTYFCAIHAGMSARVVVS